MTPYCPTCGNPRDQLTGICGGLYCVQKKPKAKKPKTLQAEVVATLIRSRHELERLRVAYERFEDELLLWGEMPCSCFPWVATRLAQIRMGLDSESRKLNKYLGLSIRKRKK